VKFSEIRSQFNVPLTLSDGTILRNDVFSPVTDEQLPALVLRVPYDKSFYYSHGTVKPYEFAKQGFIVVVQDVRGRFESDGKFEPNINEGPDGYETVEWAAKLQGSNGQVGMYGDSYVAESQWSAALENPPSLGAIAPGLSPSWSAHDGFFTRGGVHEVGCRFTWVFGAISPDFVKREVAGGDTGQTLKLMETEAAKFPPAVAFKSRTLDPFQDSATFLPQGMESLGWPLEDKRFLLNRTRNRHSEVEVPALITAGWFDVFLGSTLKQYRAARATAEAKGLKVPQLIVGPWSHLDLTGQASGMNFGPEASYKTVAGDQSLFEITVDWFNQNLKGEQSRFSKLDSVVIFDTGKHEWLHLDEFPFGFDESRSLYLASGNGLARVPAEKPGTLEYDFDPADPVPTLGGQTLVTPDMVGFLDQTPLQVRPDVVSFHSEVLSEDLNCVGQIGATIFVSTDAKDTDFVVRVCDVAPDGTSRVLADGIVRCKYRANFDLNGWTGTFNESEPLNGEVIELNLDLWAIAHTFKVGHKIGVDITSSSSPRWHVNGNTGHNAWETDEIVVARQTIHFGGNYPSRIHLPGAVVKK
jgi:putative CocE/NonD family hydrolase